MASDLGAAARSGLPGRPHDARHGRGARDARRVPGGRDRAVAAAAGGAGPARHRRPGAAAPRRRRRPARTCPTSSPGCPRCSPIAPTRPASGGSRRSWRPATCRRSSRPSSTPSSARATSPTSRRSTTRPCASMADQLGDFEHRVSGAPPRPLRAHRRPPGGDHPPVQDRRSLGRLAAPVAVPRTRPRSRSTNGCSRESRSLATREGGPREPLARPRRVHPRPAPHRPPLAPQALGAGRHLEPLPEPDRAGPAQAVGRDPPADRPGPGDLRRDALRAGRHPRGARRRRPGRRDPPRSEPHRGAEEDPGPHLHLVPARERGRLRRRRGRTGRRPSVDRRRYPSCAASPSSPSTRLRSPSPARATAAA